MAESEKQRLIAAINGSRAELSRTGRTLKSELSFKTKLRRSVSEHRAAWLVVGVVAGLIITRRLTRRPAPKPRTIRVKRGAAPERIGRAALIPLAAKFVFDLARPTIMSWMRSQVLSRFGRGAPRRKGLSTI